MRRILSSSAALLLSASAVLVGCSSATKPPVAAATVPATTPVGVWFTLDGSGSKDVNTPALPLSFNWLITSHPAASTAVLNMPTAVKPSFKPDVAGSYTVRLIVSNGLKTGTTDSTFVAGPCGVQAPAFQADSVKAVPAMPATGQAVTLSATPTDPDNDPACGLSTPQALTVTWSLVSKPVGSNTAILNPDAAQPSIVPDRPGSYDVRVTVTDSTGLSTSQDVMVTAGMCGANPPVVGEIDPSLMSPAVGSPVQLAAVVTDADNSTMCSGLGVAAQDVTYAWSFRALPIGSHATLSDPTAKNPSFTPDVPGDYLVRLVATDTTGLVSVPLEVTVTAASCGPQITMPVVNPAAPKVGDATSATVTLSTTCPRSDPQSSSFSYSWKVTDAPAASHMQLTHATDAAVQFTPDVTGNYNLHLVVADGAGRSTSAEVPVAVSGYSCGFNAPVVTKIASDLTPGAVGSPLQLTATVDDPDNDSACGLSQGIAYAWSVVSAPEGSHVALNSGSLAQPTLVPDVAGSYVVQLVVTDSTGLASAPQSFSFSATTCAPSAALSISAGQAVGAQTTVTASATTTCPGTDPNSTLYSYAFSLTAAPAGSRVRLAGTNPAFFTPDVTGTYTIAVTVTDGAGRWATSSTNVTVSADACGFNAPQIVGVAASASPAAHVPMTLHANAFDPDNGTPCNLGQVLSYRWSLQSQPAGSTAALQGSQSPDISFTPDVAGTYTVGVQVSDGTGLSATSSVSFTAAACSAPVARIGLQSPLFVPASTSVGPLTLFKNNTLWFDASQSSSSSCVAAGSPVQYQWSVVSLPAGAPGNGGLNSSSVVNPSAGPLSVTGQYVYQLVVSDAAGTSAPATITVDIQSSAPGTITNAGNVSVSMAVDPTTGNPAWAYFDQTQNAVSVTFCTANCNTTNPTLRTETVSSSLGTLTAGPTEMRGVSLAFTSKGVPEVAYFVPGSCGFAFAWRSKTTGTWAANTIASTGNGFCSSTGLGGAGSSYGRDLSLALRSDDLPGIAYLVHNTTNGQDSLAFVECTDAVSACQTASGTAPAFSKVAAADASSSQAGYAPSLKYSSGNHPRIASYNRANQQLDYSSCDTNCSSASITVAWSTADTVVADANTFGGDVGHLPSLALTSADSPRIAYADLSNSRMLYTSCNSNCLAQNGWNQQIIDFQQGDYASLVLDSTGTPYIAYTDAPNGGGPLMLALLQNGNWSKFTIDDSRPFFYTGMWVGTGPVVHIAYGDGSPANRSSHTFYTAFGF